MTTLHDHAWIGAHIPHQHAMCLLDRVDTWSAEHIQCWATNHRNSDHPLRLHDRLSATIGIEYAAQAMAVHGALLTPQGSAPRSGMLTGVRDVLLHQSRLDHLPGDLLVEAQLIGGYGAHFQYMFRIHHQMSLVLEGRCSLICHQSGQSDQTIKTASV